MWFGGDVEGRRARGPADGDVTVSDNVSLLVSFSARISAVSASSAMNSRRL